MRDITIKKRLYVGAGLVISTLLGVLCLNMYNVWRASSSLQTIYEDYVVPTAALSEMDGELKEIRFRLAGYVINQLPAVGNRRHLQEARTRVTNAWATVQSRSAQQNHESEVDDRATIAHIKAHLPAVEGLFDRLDGIYAQHDQAAALAVLEDEWPYVVHLGVIKPIAHLLPGEQLEVKDTYQATTEQWRRMLVLTVVILSAVMVSLSVFTVRLVSAITSPLTVAVDVTRRIAAGDMTTPIEVGSRDEVGQLLESFSHMRRQVMVRQQRLETILETAAEGVITIDAGGLIESFNRAAESLFGWPQDEMLGTPISRLISACDEGLAEGSSAVDVDPEPDWRVVLKPGGARVGRRRDGTRFPIDLKISSMVLQG
ncbi:MAG: HAMP domain-containing protein, partial [Candidatus Manganitrophaceae bacterium]